MAETVKACGVSKESGYLYYLGKDGNVWRSKMARAGKGGGNAEKVANAGVTRESGLSLIHISEPTRRRGISYAVFCLKKKRPQNNEAFFKSGQESIYDPEPFLRELQHHSYQ